MKISRLVKKLKQLIRGEQGQILPLVLILLVLGSTLLAGTLAYGSASLKTSEINEDRAEQLYSADAGVRYALWKLTNEWDVGDNLQNMFTNDSTQYIINENGKNVVVDIFCIRKVLNQFSYIFKITATANGAESSTSIETYVTKIFGLWTNAATGGTTVDIWWGGGTVVDGPVVYPYDTSQWPFAAPGLRALYIGDTSGIANPITVIDVSLAGNDILEPLYADPAGGTLDIKNSNNNPFSSVLGPGTPLPGKGNGTLYIDGNLQIGKNGSKPFTLDMNRNTIYATGDILIDPSVTLLGSGCIIAEGQIEFKPNLSSASPDDFIFVMSLSSASYSVQFEPGGTFYGSIAGNIDIDLHPGNTVVLTEPPPDGLNFPLDDGSLPAIWAMRTWQINRLSGVAAATLTISTASLPQGEQSIAYSRTLTATGGVQPYDNWSITGGALPAGLTLGLLTGEISGTPTAFGTANFTVSVDDDAGGTAVKNLSITVQPPPTINPTTLDDAEVGVAYSYALGVTGGIPAYTWTINPAVLPAGLNHASGVISGIPTTANTYNFQGTVTDSVGGQGISPLTITVHPAVSISTASLPDGKKNKAYGAAGGVPAAAQFVTASNGLGPYTWSILSGKPPNLVINGATGQLTGNLKNADVGTWTIRFRVVDSLGGVATRDIQLIVNN